MSQEPVTRHVHRNNVYVVHDVHVHQIAGSKASGWIAFSINDGDLKSSCFTFEQLTPQIRLLDFTEKHLAEVGGLVDEVSSEVAEDVAYTRDLNREKN